MASGGERAVRADEKQRPVHIGVIGLGRAGMYHIERFSLRDDCRVIATFDADPAVRIKSADPSRTMTDTCEQLLSLPDVDLVVIATPPATHAPLARAALAAGKHVLLETPLALSLADADALLQSAQHARRTLCVAQLRRWDEDFRTAQHALRDLPLAPLISASFSLVTYNPLWLQHGAAGGTAGPSAVAPTGWQSRTETGGGALWEFGVHDLDQLLQLLPEPPHSVFARLHASPLHAGLDDGYLAIVQFPSGATAQIEVLSAALPPRQTGWVLAGAAGGYADFTHYTTVPDGEIIDTPVPPLPTTTDTFYTELLQHLRTGTPAPVSLPSARQVVALIEAIQRSAASGRVEPVAP